MTPQELRNAELRYQRALAKAETERCNRNHLVQTALAERWTHAAISAATGLTRGRIGQLAQRRTQAQTPP